MGRIVISTNISLDGVVQDPDGQEGHERGGWFTTSGGKDLELWAQNAAAEAMGANALLLGRRSDEWFASRWQTRTGPWADRLNGLPKYVTSSTLTQPVWQNGTVLSGDAAAEIVGLRDRTDGEILIYGSYELGQTLIECDLVDEFRLCVFPVLVGAGKRLFGQTSGTKALRLMSTRMLGERLTLLTYEVVR